jgi:hypothetical protein
VYKYCITLKQKEYDRIRQDPVYDLYQVGNIVQTVP